MLYVYAGCSFRGVTKVLEVINLVLFQLPESIPSHTMIKNWIEKCGLDVYIHRGKTLNEAYSLIIDESISVGGEKILLQLKAPAQHQGHPLTHADVEVVGMHVGNSWTSDKVQNAISDTTKTLGNSPDYVTSDHGANLTKAIRDSGISHHLDISHTLGTFLENVYKEDAEFKEFTKQMGVTRKFSLTKFAYLMPPNQRSLARFMNLFEWVRWAKNMLDNFYTFTNMERTMYSFIPKHASLIEELTDVMSAYEQIQSSCKHAGFSKKTADKCQTIVYRSLMTRGNRTRTIGYRILDYIRNESQLLESPTSNHNISSDVIETTFGFYKDRKSPNKSFGVTSFILTIPLHTKLADLKDAQSFDVREVLERVKVKEVKEWADKNLKQSLVAKRTQKFAYSNELSGTIN